jgi:hypothetical protein
VTVKQRKDRFWPGFSWRILAHKRANVGRATVGSYQTGGQVDICSEQFAEPVEFDELVIDNWLHIEQMGDRDWWIGLGHDADGCPYEWMINVHVDRFGRAHVSMERE